MSKLEPNLPPGAPPGAALRIGLAGLLALLGACSHLHAVEPSNWHAHWPWHHAQPEAQVPVNELVVEAEAGSATPPLVQTWERNTLRVAMSGVAGEGTFSLRPVQGHGWPIRLEFLVQPGSFAHLELRGDQRVILSVPAGGGAAVLSVPQGIYAQSTTQLTLHYGS